MKLEAIGKILAGGFGEGIAAGVFIGFLDGVTPERVYEYIRDNLELGYWVSEKDWQKAKRLVKQANIGDITREKIVSELRKHRADILGVILNDPKGMDWLDKQVSQMKQKLGIE